MKITLHPVVGVKPEFSEWVLDAYVSVSLTAAAHHSAWSQKLTSVPTNRSYECTRFLGSPSPSHSDVAFLPYQPDISLSQPAFASRDRKSSYVGICLLCCKWSCLPPSLPVALGRKILATGKAIGKGYFLHRFQKRKDAKWHSLLLPIFFKYPFIIIIFFF